MLSKAKTKLVLIHICKALIGHNRNRDLSDKCIEALFRHFMHVSSCDKGSQITEVLGPGDAQSTCRAALFVGIALAACH